jgi:hypothetical protein
VFKVGTPALTHRLQDIWLLITSFSAVLLSFHSKSLLWVKAPTNWEVFRVFVQNSVVEPKPELQEPVLFVVAEPEPECISVLNLETT